MTDYRHQSACRGFTLLETIVAISLLAAGLIATAKVLVACAHERLAAQQLLVAQWELANVQEQIAALRYDNVAPESIGKFDLTADAQAALPYGAQLVVTLTDSTSSTSDLPHKLIRAEISWPSVDGTRQTVALTSWKYAGFPEASP